MKKLAMFLALLVAGSVLLAPVTGYALFESSKDQACKGIALDEYASCQNAQLQNSKANNLIQTAISVFAAIIGIIAVVMIMVGGIKYMTSQGDSAQVSAAKNTILYAVIGLVIAILARSIAKFVIGRFIT